MAKLPAIFLNDLKIINPTRISDKYNFKLAVITSAFHFSLFQTLHVNQALPFKGSKSDCSPTALLNLLRAVIIANSFTNALLQDSKKSYLMLPCKFQMTKPGKPNPAECTHICVQRK